MATMHGVTVDNLQRQLFSVVGSFVCHTWQVFGREVPVGHELAQMMLITLVFMQFIVQFVLVFFLPLRLFVVQHN